MRFLLIGNPENRRVAFFLQACARLSLPTPVVVSWEQILLNEGGLEAAAKSCDVLRIESPGENARVDSLLVARGGGIPFSEEDYKGGRIGNQRAWYLGWQSVLSYLQELLGEALPMMNSPEEIALMFDKYRCQNHLIEAGVSAPPILGLAQDSSEVFRLMDECHRRRVFVKPRHSSSASGVVALQRQNHRILATTSVKIEEGGLYNSLRMSRYETLQEVEVLLDLLGPENFFVERWFPKAVLGGRAVDFRVLVISGKVRHVVARTSRSPITNLHLGNARGDLNDIKKQLGDGVWTEAINTCEQAAATFPKCHYIAVDLMISSSMESVAVAEVNAFGDLLPNLLSHGQDSYEAELATWLAAS